VTGPAIRVLSPDAGLDLAQGASAATLIIACGALARELVTVLRASRFGGIAVTCLPAILHNRPERITDAVRRKIRDNRARYDRILCLYGDCGTGGALDAMLAEEGVARISGAHCYEFLFGAESFATVMDEEPGTFFLTDYLARHFDRLVIEGLGMDRHPELLPVYFGNYRKLTYLAQVRDDALADKARAAADRLGLAYEQRWTGLSSIEAFVSAHALTASQAA
jgi:hypothetical protein